MKGRRQRFLRRVSRRRRRPLGMCLPGRGKGCAAGMDPRCEGRRIENARRGDGCILFDLGRHTRLFEHSLGEHRRPSCPPTVYCRSVIRMAIQGSLLLTCTMRSGTRRQFHTAYRDLPVAIPAIDVSLGQKSSNVNTHGLCSRFLPRGHNIPPESTTGQMI